MSARKKKKQTRTRTTATTTTTTREKQRRKITTVRRRSRRRTMRRRRRRRRTTTTPTTETASRTLLKTHCPDPPLYNKIPQPDPHVFFTLGIRFPSILLFQASKHPRGIPPLFWASLNPILASHFPKCPPPTPPRLASLYTYTQPRPSAGFGKHCIQYIHYIPYIPIHTYT